MPLAAPISHLHLFLIFSNRPHGCRFRTTLQMSRVYRARETHNWSLSHIKQETGSFILLLHRDGLKHFRVFIYVYAQVLMYVCMHACMHVEQRTVLGVTPWAPSSVILDTRFLIGTRSLLIRPGWLANESEGSFLPLHPQRWDYRHVLPCPAQIFTWFGNSARVLIPVQQALWERGIP